MKYIIEIKDKEFGVVKNDYLAVRKGYNMYDRYTFTVRDTESSSDSLCSLSEVMVMDLYGVVPCRDGDLYLKINGVDLSGVGVIYKVEEDGVLPFETDMCELMKRDKNSSYLKSDSNVLCINASSIKVMCIDHKNMFFMVDTGIRRFMSGLKMLFFLQNQCNYRIDNYWRLIIIDGDNNCTMCYMDESKLKRAFLKKDVLER